MNVVEQKREHGEKEESLHTRLCRACKDGDIEKVQSLLQTRHLNPWSKVTYNLTKELPRTPLIETCLQNRLDLVQILLDNGEDVNDPDIDGFTPLQAYLKEGTRMTFCKDRMSEMISLLLSKGADPNFKEHDSYSTLILGVLTSSPKLVELLLDAGADPNYKDNISHVGQSVEESTLIGLSALHACIVQYGKQLQPEEQSNILQLLLSKGADPNICEDTYPPLRIATLVGSLSIVSTLIGSGAVVSIRSSRGRTALHACVMLPSMTDDKFDVVAIFGCSPMVDWNQRGSILKMVGKGLTANETDADGNNILLLYLKSLIRFCKGRHLIEADLETNDGFWDFFNLVMESKGETINHTDKTGTSALALSALSCFPKITKRLLDIGADVNVRYGKGKLSILHACCTLSGFPRKPFSNEEWTATLRLLVSEGVDIDTVNSNGYTPLHWLLKEARNVMTNFHQEDSTLEKTIDDMHLLEMTNVLIDLGSNSKKCVTNVSSALHAVFALGYRKTAERLLECGACISICLDDNTSVLHAACENVVQDNLNSKMELMKMAIDRGINLSERDNDVLTCAIRNLLKVKNYRDRAKLMSILDFLLQLNADLSVPCKDGSLPLLMAAQHGDLLITSRLLSAGANVNQKGAENETPLIECLHLTGRDTSTERFQTREQIASLLIDHGADVNAITKNGVTPLKQIFLTAHALRKHGLLEHIDTLKEMIRTTVSKLLESGADPNLTIDSFESPLVCAIRACSVEGVRFLLSYGADVNVKDYNDCSAMEIVFTTVIHTEENERVEIAGMLMEKDVYFELEPDNDYPLLYKALRCMSPCETEKNIVAVVYFLLSNGANPNTVVFDRTHWEDSALVGSKTTACNQKLCELPKSCQPILYFAIQNCSPRVVEALLIGGTVIDVYRRPFLLNTCLENLKACSDGYRDLYEKIQILCCAVADVNYATFLAGPTFLRTLFNTFEDSLRKVVQCSTLNSSFKNTHVAKTFCITRDQLSPYVLDITKLLRSHGFDITEKGILEQAVKIGSYECVKYLLDEGASYDIVDKQLNTPLHHAIGLKGVECEYRPLQDRFDLAELLIKHGANIKARNVNLDSPFNLAVWHVFNAEEREKQNALLFLKFLLEKGVDLDTTSCTDDPLVFRRRWRRTHSSFLEAVKKNDLDVVRLLLQFGSDVNSVNASGSDALTICLEQNDVCAKTESMMKLLITNGANVNGNDKEQTRKYRNYRRGFSLTSLQSLLHKREQSDGSNILNHHSKTYLSMLRWLIANGVDVNMAAEGTCPPLLQAVSLNSVEIVHLLVSSGAKINITYQDRFTPLGLSCLNDCKDTFNICKDRPDRLSMVKLLVESGADVNFRPPCGFSPLQLLTIPNATSRYSEEEKFSEQLERICLPILEYLLEKGADPIALQDPPILRSAKIGSVDFMRLLIKFGADVNVKGEDNLTPLQTCCSSIDICDRTESMVKLLIDNGADVNMAREGTCPPLMQAVNLNSLEIAHLLVSSGAKVNITHVDRFTPLGLACINDCKDTFNICKDRPDRLSMVKLLVESGADVNFRPPCGFSPLQHLTIPNATSRYSEEEKFSEQLEGICLPILEYLLEKGADPIALQDPPILRSAKIGSVDFMRLLIKFGADVNVKGEDNLTPLQTCCSAMDICDRTESMVKLLIDNGADVNMACEGTCPPLMQAVNLNSLEIAQLLVSSGAKVNITHVDRFTPLGLACINDCNATLILHKDRPDRLAMVKLLVDCGADTNLRASRREFSPLQFLTTLDSTMLIRDYGYWEEETPSAVEIHQLEKICLPILEFLLEKGANPNAFGRGDPPISSSAKIGSIDFVQLLLHYGADVNTKTEDDFTPLQTCCSAVARQMTSAGTNLSHFFSTIKTLIEAGGNLRHGLTSGLSPIQLIIPKVQPSDTYSKDVEMSDSSTEQVDDYINVVEYLIKKGASVNALKNTHIPPLVSAISWKNENLVRTLLLGGADVNFCDMHKRTPLHVCCTNLRTGSINIVQQLLLKKADVNVGSNMGVTPFELIMDAIDQSSNLESVDTRVIAEQIAMLLIEAGANVNDRSRHSKTPWVITITKRGSFSFLEYLLKSGVKVNSLNTDERNVLHVGFSDVLRQPIADKEIVAKAKLLLQYGANVNQEDKNGNTPLEVMLDVFDAFLKRSPSGVLFRKNSDLEIITKLTEVYIKAGANVNTSGNNLNGKSALTIAVLMKHKALVELLLQAGSNVNAASTEYGTALTTFCRTFALCDSSSANLEIAEILLQHGADTNFKPAGDENAGALVTIVDRIKTCLEIPTHALDLLRLLFKYGADANLLHGENNLLLNADLHGNIILMSLLLQHGANVHEVTDDGSNALHMCLSSGNPLKIKLNLTESLIKCGVNVNWRKKAGRTPMDLFCESLISYHREDRVLQKELLHILVSCGAKPKMMAKKNTVDQLIRNGNFKIAKYMLQTCMTLEMDGAKLPTKYDRLLSRKQVKERKFMEIVLSRNFDVPSLSACCRVAIREHLVQSSGNRNLKDNIDTLGLPRSLSDFLQFDNEYQELLSVGYQSPFRKLRVLDDNIQTQHVDVCYANDERCSIDIDTQEQVFIVDGKKRKVAYPNMKTELKKITEEDNAYPSQDGKTFCEGTNTVLLQDEMAIDLLKSEEVKALQGYNEELEIALERDIDGGKSKELMKIPKRWDDWDFSDDEDVWRVDYRHVYHDRLFRRF